jgi:hypothetical protein
MRFLVYSVLSHACYTSPDDFKKTIRVYIDSLEYKDDKIKIFESIRQLCRNNIVHIDSGFIYTILNIDKNFLISEYRWNDLAYNANLLILQEFIISGNNTGLTVPYFFVKHFHYLSDRYQGIFEKRIKDLLADKHYNLNRKDIVIAGDYGSLFKADIVEISKYESNYTLTGVYSALFGFLNEFVGHDDGMPLSVDTVATTRLVFDIICRINFKLQLAITVSDDSDTKSNYYEIIKLNDIICEILLYHLRIQLGVIGINTDEVHAKIEKLKKFKSIENYKEGKNCQVIKEISEIVGNEKLMKITISQPKKNYQYECNRSLSGKQKSIPFFLNIVVKLKGGIVCDKTKQLSGLTYNHIMRNLSLKLTDVKANKYHFYQSDIGRRDNYIMIKKTICLYIGKSEKYNLGLYIHNPYQQDLDSLLGEGSITQPVDSIIFNILK